MFAEERHKMILELLSAEGKVLVKELAERFSVTEDSIRKDLSALEQDGLLKRTYGGAITISEKLQMTEANRRRITAVEAKRHIANIAARLIHSDQLVFLDTSTISIAIADILARSNQPLRILTNMLDVAVILAPNPAIHLIFSGGTLNPARDGFTDSLALAALDRFYPDVAFLAASALDLEGNAALCHDTNSAILKSLILSHANRSFLIAEDAKFHATANFRFAALDHFHAIISNSTPPNSTLPFLSRKK